MSTAGRIWACSTSRGGATPRSSACRARASRRSSPPRACSARCWKTSWWTRRRAPSTSTRRRSRRTRGRRTRSTTCRTTSRAAWGGHPSHVVFLTCDAYGVLPPLARLSPAQAMYHFLSGYTAKVAGTERGVTEPKATFSTCFGAPFLPLAPNVYASLLGEKIAQHGVQCWLVNTGWSGGPYGVGERIRLGLTRAMVRAALAGTLDRPPTAPEPVFGLEVPLQGPGVPDALLLPRGTWSDAAAYDAQAARLAQMFRQNFEQFSAHVHVAVREAGPRL